MSACADAPIAQGVTLRQIQVTQGSPWLPSDRRDATCTGRWPRRVAANILFNVLKITVGHGVTIGPMLLGTAAPAHVLTPSATVRRLVNMTALAVAEAQARR